MSMPIAARAAAVLAAGSAALHGSSLVAAVHPWLAGLTVTMIAGCGFCAYELWTRDTVRAWVLVAVMNLAMVGMHLPLPAGHQHGGVGERAAASMQLATWVAIAEVLLAAAVLFVRSRANAPAVIAPCQSGHHDSGGASGRQAGRNFDRLPEPG